MSNIFDIAKSKDRRLTKKEFAAGTIIAVFLLIVWIIGSSGMSLIARFVPGLLFVEVVCHSPRQTN